MKTKFIALFIALFVGTMGLTACGGGDTYYVDGYNVDNSPGWAQSTYCDYGDYMNREVGCGFSYGYHTAFQKRYGHYVPGHGYIGGTANAKQRAHLVKATKKPKRTTLSKIKQKFSKPKSTSTKPSGSSTNPKPNFSKNKPVKPSRSKPSGKK